MLPSGFALNRILKAQSGAFWDYWFTENEILQVKVVSQWVTMALFVVILTLFFLTAGLGAALSAVIAFIMAYLLTARIASSRRKATESLSIQDITAKGRVKVRVPWQNVGAVELIGRNLTILVNRRKYRAKISQTDAQAFKEFFKSRMREKFTAE